MQGHEARLVSISITVVNLAVVSMTIVSTAIVSTAIVQGDEARLAVGEREVSVVGDQRARLKAARPLGGRWAGLLVPARNLVATDLAEGGVVPGLGLGLGED